VANRTETLLFLIDVQVRGANALRALDSDLDAAAANHERRLLALNDVVTGNGNGDALPNGNGANGRTIIVDRANGNGNRNSTPGASRDAIVGIRGRENPGSRNNPIVFAQESGEASGLGSLAAASGDTSRGERPAVRPAPVAAPAQSPDVQKSWLLQAAETVAATQRASEQSRMLDAIGAASQLRKNVGPSSNPLLAGAEQVAQAQAETSMIQEAARTVSAARLVKGAGGGSPAATLAGADAVHRASSPDMGTLASVLAARVASQQGPPVMLNAAAAASRLGVSRSRVYDLAGAGALAGAQKQGGAWQIPEQAVLDMMGGGGGGGGLPPVATGGGGDQGASPINWRRALMGTGMLGLAGFGTLGSFAGLGPEHLAMTALGIAGSAGGALGGAGLLGLGAAGTMAVGAGSDMGVMTSAIADTKTLSADYTSLAQAVGVYGKNSAQAHQAQAQLNYDMKNLGPGTKYEAQLAQQANALNTLWDQTTGHARLLSVQILDQVLSLASQMMPMVVSAAQRNLAIIDNDIRPLFTWLKGPEGIQIWSDLENQFATNLPTAIGAFNQGVELLLRTTQIASQYTGGFTQHLDDLFKRLNSENNGQLDAEISKLIGDFELWRHFVDALIIDIARLFSNDVGTGASIISELTQMLDKLGLWEQSVHGRQDLMTIFTVHKAEIDQLLQVLPLLVNAYMPLYMTLAPALTTAFTTVAKAIIDVVKAIEEIPGGALALGFGLIATKISFLVPLWTRLATAIGLTNKAQATNIALTDAQGGAVGKLTLTGDAAKAASGSGAGAVEGGAAGGALGGLLGRIGASGVGTAISGGVESATLGVAGAAEGAGMAGLAGAITGAGAAVAPVAAALLPLLAAAGGVYGLVQLFGLFSSGGTAPKSKYTGNQLAQLLQQQGKGALNQPGGVATGPSAHSLTGLGTPATGNPLQQQSPGATVSQLGSTQAAKQALDAWVKSVSNSTDVAKMSIPQLQGMVREGQALAQIFPQDAQVIDKFTNKVKTDLAPLQSVMGTMTSRWNSDAVTGLKGLTDIFDSNTRLIAHSANGEQLMHTNVQRMVFDVTNAMQAGETSVKLGMAAIKDALQKGMQDGAITWQTEWKDMFSTVDGLYKNHKIDTQTYLNDLRSIERTAVGHIASDTESSYQAMYAQLKQQYNDGYLTQAQFYSKVTGLRSQDKQNMAAWAENLLQNMMAAGAATGAGTLAVAGALNKILKELGAAPISVAQLAGGAAKNADLVKQEAAGYLPHGATGMKVNAPTYVVGEEGAAHPEYVLATNPAYRQRNLGLWAQAGSALGVPGFAEGGVSEPSSGTWQAYLRLMHGYWNRLAGSGDLPHGSSFPTFDLVRSTAWGPERTDTQSSSHHIEVPWWTADSATSSRAPGNMYATFEGVYEMGHALQSAATLRSAMRVSEGGDTAWDDIVFPKIGKGDWRTLLDPFQSYAAWVRENKGTNWILRGQFGGADSASDAVPGFAKGGTPGTVTAPGVSGGGTMGAITADALKEAAKAANDYITKKTPSSTGGGSVKGVPVHVSGSLASWLAQGMALAGVSGGAWLGMLERQAMRESSGSPGSINNWDSNAAAGDPSEGLLQTTLSTFASYMVSGHGNILNPVDNTAAAIRYMIARYGGGSSAQALSFMIANGGNAYAQGGKVGWAGNFADGGWATANGPTLAMFGENGIETAMFLPHYKTGGMPIPTGPATNEPQSSSVRSGNDANLPWANSSAINLVVGYLTDLLKGLTTTVSTMQTNAQNLSTLDSAVGGLNSGTSLKSLGLTGSALKATGMSASTLSAMMGGGPAMYAEEVNQASQQVTQYKTQQSQLEADYKIALETHNKTLQSSLLGELDTVDQAIITATQAGQAALVAEIQATAQQFADQATAIGNSLTSLQAIQGLTGGEDLSSLGLSPDILATLGLSGAQGQVGNALANYQTLATNQGGVLTAAQLAGATSGVNAQNTMLGQEEAPIEQELSYYQSQLPSLTGSNYTSTVATMQQLVQQLLGLQTSVDSNTSGLTALTTATTANTTATTTSTGAMTGTTSFSYQGQNGYMASLSSDSVTNLGVGS